MHRRWYLVIFFFPLLVEAQGLDLQFQHFGFAEGLPSQSIQCLFQDQRGYLWIGTPGGTSRYDGYSFTNYAHHPFDSTSLAANDVKAIVETPDGRLYFGMQGGLSRYRWETDDFELIRDGENGRRLWEIRCMSDDDTGNVWIGRTLTPSIFSKLDPQERLIEYGNRQVLSMLTDGRQIWIGNRQSLWNYNRETDTFRRAEDLLPGFSLPPSQVYSLIRDQQQRLWIGTSLGLFWYDPEWQKMHGPATGSPLDNQVILSLLEDQQGKIWAGTTQGLHCLDQKGQWLGQYKPDPNDRNGLQGSVITDLLQDKAGNLWVGTYRGGLHKAKLAFQPRFQALNAPHFGLRTGQLDVYSFAEGQHNRIWVGTSRGLFLLDKHSKNILQQYSVGSPDSLGLRYPVIKSLVETPDEQLLIGYQDGMGLGILDINGQKIWHFPDHPDSLSHFWQEQAFYFSEIRRIVPDRLRPGYYWLICGNGVIEFRLPTKQLRLVSFCQPPTPSQAETCVDRYSWDGWQDQQGRLWVANREGLLRFEPKSDRFQHYRLFPPSYIREHIAISVREIQDNLLAVGTYGDGLLIVDEQGQLQQNFSTRKGLNDNYVIGILPDEEGYLWISTIRGLARFDLNQEVFQTFHLEDGLPTEAFTTGAYLKTQDGEMYFGGNDGCIAFYPQEIESQASTFPPPLYLDHFDVSIGEITQDSTAGFSFHSHPGQRLDLHFTALDFTQPNRNFYQWYLEGYEQNWQYPSLQRQLSYTNLPPGTYQFHLRASNGEGVFGAAKISRKIVVIPLFVQTRWFRWGLPLLLVGMVGLGVYLFFLQRSHSERQRLNKRIDSVRQEALASQMDQHFTFNSLNSIQRFIAENDTPSALQYVARFGKLMRNMLHQARQNTVTLEEEIQTLDLYLSLEQLRTKQGFTYALTITEELDPFTTEIPSGLIHPFIENAIWHGLMPLPGQGELKLHFAVKDGQIQAVLTDNGIGRAAAAQQKALERPGHQSKGMQITQERIATLNALFGWELKVSVRDRLDLQGHLQGTEVVFHMPLL